jgi:hypothetical protein
VIGAAAAGALLVGVTVGDWLGGPVALLTAVWTGWRLRFRPSPGVGIWQRQAAMQRRTAGMLGPLADEGYLVLHDVTLPGWLGSLEHLVVGPTGVWVVGSGQGRRRLPGEAGAPAGMLRGCAGRPKLSPRCSTAGPASRSGRCCASTAAGRAASGRSRAARWWPHGSSPRSSTPGPRWPLTRSSGPLPGCWRCCDRRPEHEGPERANEATTSSWPVGTPTPNSSRCSSWPRRRQRGAEIDGTGLGPPRNPDRVGHRTR